MRGYKDFFKIKGKPFDKGVPTAALLRYDQFQELGQYLAYVAEEGSIGMLTGEIGAGKSTAVRAFIETLDDRRVHLCYVGSADATRSVFRRLAWSFGMRAAFLKGDLKDDVHARVGALWDEHQKRTLLIIDDAQALGGRGLQELRLLTNFYCDAESPLGLLLVGDPKLRSLLKELPNEALDQRIMVRYHLAGLSLAETGQYIKAHLTAVAADPELFTADAIQAIFQHSRGLPRRINKIAIQSLLKAGHKEVRPIDQALVAAVLKDIAQE